jgi:pyruvate dehydrogenase E2 component (dihydrolipoamide acetyltransferase)
VAKIIDLPKLSPTMEEGTLVRWVKNEGDAIEVDDLLAEVETDKATMEFRAFDRGTLLKRLVAEGATAKLGQPVAIFGNPGEDISALLAKVGGGAPPAAAPPAETKPAAAPPTEAKPAPAPPPAEAKPAVPPTPTVPTRPPGAPAPAIAASTPGIAGVLLLPTRVAAPAAPAAPALEGQAGGPASPRVRRLARERGIALESVTGSGPHGRITVEDLERGARAPRPAAPAPRPEDTVRPATQMRKTIARRLTEAKRDVPHFYLEADLDVEALVALREQLNESAEKDARISINDLLIRACALALREVPTSNASWVDGNIVQHHRVDISVAVAIEDGLVTPVVRDADLKSIRAISAEVRDLAARARAKKLKLEEMQGGVFSISNLGMYGIDRFSAVINPPEGMILAVGATRDVPVVRNARIVPGKRCAVTLSCDHRVVDGALGAQFLKALRGLVEHPVKILA